MNTVYIRVSHAVERAVMNNKRWESMDSRRWSVTGPSVTGYKETSID
jgi:hypothetical protein